MILFCIFYEGITYLMRPHSNRKKKKFV